MSFLNNTQILVRNSNEDLFNFYIEHQSLFMKKFIAKQGWTEPTSLINAISVNQFSVSINENDMLYGILNNNNGEVFYLYSSKEKIEYETLFKFHKDKYVLLYPSLLRLGSKIHITYYLQNNKNRMVWALINHYFDGKIWHENIIDIISVNPVINPFYITNNLGFTNIFYMNQVDRVEEIFLKKFDIENNSWINKKQITFSGNNKIYLDVLNDARSFYHMVWGEFINNNLVVKYKKVNIQDNNLDSQKDIILSEPSNCSFPTIIKTNNTIWVMWVQMNKLYSCYSLDEGITWSNPNIDSKSIDVNFIRYKFYSNYTNDLNSFKLNTAFGTYYPSISFIGFQNIK